MRRLIISIIWYISNEGNFNPIVTDLSIITLGKFLFIRSLKSKDLHNSYDILEDKDCWMNGDMYLRDSY